jgi:tetratricopeptide (TPR) repeat protein
MLNSGVNVMISKRVFFFSLLVLFSASEIQLASGQTQYRIEGVVYGPDSRPLPNILVSLQNSSRAQIAQDITNSDGHYQFSGIVAGSYYLIVKPAQDQLHPVLQQLELMDTSRGGSSMSSERVDFTLRTSARRVDPASAATVFAQSVPPEAEREYLLAMKSSGKGDREEALEHLAKAIAVFPTYFLAIQQRGLLYVELTKQKEAIEALTNAIKINPKSAEAHLGLGMTYVGLDQLPAAIEELNISRSLDPRLFRTHLYLGMAFIGVDDLDAAEQALKQAYTLGGPTDGRAAHLYLASIYDKRKQYQKAVNELETYLRDNPKATNASKIKEAIQKLKAKS